MSSISLKLLMLFWALNKVFLPLNGSIAVLFGYAIIAFSIILPLEILFLGKYLFTLSISVFIPQTLCAPSKKSIGDSLIFSNLL